MYTFIYDFWFLMDRFGEPAATGCAHGSLGASSLTPSTLEARNLCRQIVRLHDLYISSTQACLYRAPGSVFGVHGMDRRAAMTDILQQFKNIANIVDKAGGDGPYLCGPQLSYADCVLFPTMVFADFMFPQFFKVSLSPQPK